MAKGDTDARELSRILDETEEMLEADMESEYSDDQDQIGYNLGYVIGTMRERKRVRRLTDADRKVWGRALALIERADWNLELLGGNPY